ncbi:MAG TPA: pantetheine-phosphate adenylyltransferase [Patescibacteria group bacterium]|nr:pantetheine-phosphate adenylyltransferase [Patescibacteria group bacterium]
MLKIIKKNKVIIGGTFDVLHAGHKSLLKRAFSLGKVTIGLTSNRMAEKTKKRKVRNFQNRKRELEKFIKKELKSGFKIIKIEDKFGPTLKEDFDYIVVSPATYKTAQLINRKRRKINRKPMKIVRIKFVLAENGKSVSAIQILNGLMTEEGKLVKK